MGERYLFYISLIHRKFTPSLYSEKKRYWAPIATSEVSIYQFHFCLLLGNTLYNIYNIYNIYLPSRTRTPRTLAPGPRPASTDPPWTSSRIWKLRYEIRENIRRMNLIKQLLNNFMNHEVLMRSSWIFFYLFLFAGNHPEGRESAAPLAEHAEGIPFRHWYQHHQRVNNISWKILLQSEKPSIIFVS